MVTTLVRTFPDPDPMIRFIDPEDGPPSFWRMSPQSRSLYLRFYLVARCAGLDEMVAWHVTFAEGGAEYVRSIVAMWPDDRLERAIADAAKRTAAGLPPQIPFTG